VLVTGKATRAGPLQRSVGRRDVGRKGPGDGSDSNWFAAAARGCGGSGLAKANQATCDVYDDRNTRSPRCVTLRRRADLD